MKLLVAASFLYASTAIGLSQDSAPDTLEHYQKDLAANPKSSLAHYRIAELFMRQRDYQMAANELRESLAGDLEPRWTVVWSHLSLAWIFDLNGQHERALNEYAQAEQTGGIDITVAAEYLLQRDPADDLPLPAGTYRIGGDVIAPEAVQRSEPEYSEEARLAGLEGTVLLTGVITENGLAREMRVTRSLGLGLDERAFDAVKEWRFSPGSYQGRPVPVLMSVAVDFRLPAVQSRWHLVRATFQTPEGSFRPAFRRAKYPTGAGVGIRSIEQARVVAAVGRLATVTVSFEVDKQGVPGHFQVRKASAALWGDEAIALLSNWRFLPGTKDGVPISVPCTLGFVWGQRKLTAAAQSRFSTDTVAPEVPPPPEDFFPPEAVLVGRGRQASGLMTNVTPEYPLLAQHAHIQGPVLFAALVGIDGRVRKLYVINGNPLLVPTAVGAVKKWVYRPTIVSGKPVEVATEIEVNFTLPREIVIR